MSHPNLSNDQIIAKSRSVEGCLGLSTDELFRALGVTMVFDAIPDDQTTRGKRTYFALEKRLKEKFPEILCVKDATDHSQGENPYI